MSSQKYAAPLALEISVSWLFATILLVAHGIALILVFLIPQLPMVVSSILAAALAVHAGFSVSRHALLRAQRSVVRLLWNAADVWSLTFRDGTTTEAQLLSGSFVHPILTVLNFRITRWRRVSVVIFPGRVDAEIFRKLRVRLRLTRTSVE